MTPEEGMRLLNDPDEWNLTLRPRADAFPARRRMSPWVVSFATIAAVAVVGVILFSVFGLTIQNVRQPVHPPAVPTSAPSASASPTPTSTPTSTPTAAGAVTCESLLDAKTVADLKAAGSVVTDDAYTQKVVDEDAQAGGTRIGLATFVKYGGIICGWGGEGTDLSFMYAYGPITSDQAADAVGRLVKKSFVKSDGQDRYTNGPQQFAFYDGYWAYAYDNGGGSKLDEVISHAPGFAAFVPPPAKAATPAKAPYLTSEGFGDIRIGAPVPSTTALATFDPAGCGSGSPAWLPAKQYRDHLSLRAPGRTAPVQFIVLYDSTIPTKSGIRVGDSLATLLATYKHFDGKPSGAGGLWEIDGTAGKVLFQLENDVVAVIATVPIDSTISNFLSTDAFGTCIA